MTKEARVEVIVKVLRARIAVGFALADSIAREISDNFDGDDREATGNCAFCGQPLPEFAGIAVDRGRGEIRFAGKRLGSLTGKEFAVFDVLLRKRGGVATKDDILSDLYGLRPGSEEPDMKIVDVFVCKLRKKLAGLGIDIETVWGRGYRLKDPGGEK